jgi:hypothetical protein
MGASERYSGGEAWKPEYPGEIPNGNDPLQPTTRLGRIASAVCDAFELFGYDSMSFLFLGR